MVLAVSSIRRGRAGAQLPGRPVGVPSPESQWPRVKTLKPCARVQPHSQADGEVSLRKSTEAPALPGTCLTTLEHTKSPFHCSAVKANEKAGLERSGFLFCGSVTNSVIKEMASRITSVGLIDVYIYLPNLDAL